MSKGIQLAILMSFTLGAWACLQGQAMSSGKMATVAPLEVTLGYSANRTSGSANSSFWMQGGKAEFSAVFTRNFSLVGELAVQHVSDINSVGEDLGLTSYLFGPRYTMRKFGQFTPFGQVLVGGVHGFDAYFPSNSVSNSVPDAFAWAAGGGVNIRVSHYLAIRPVQADYFQTQLPNDAANRENNLRLGAGIVFLIGTAN